MTSGARDAASRREGLSEEAQVELKELEELLKPPRADWVVEEGKWSCFGQSYDVSSISFMCLHMSSHLDSAIEVDTVHRSILVYRA